MTGALTRRGPLDGARRTRLGPWLLLAAVALLWFGLLEVRGLGIRCLPHEPLAVVGLVADLGQPDTERLPEPAQREAKIEGITLPRLAVAAGSDALPVVLAYLQSADGPG